MLGWGIVGGDFVLEGGGVQISACFFGGEGIFADT